MRVRVIQILSSVSAFPPSSLINPNHGLLNNKSRTAWRCSTGHGGRSGGSPWDSNAEKTIRAERFRFNLEDEFVADDPDESFGFGSATKKRIWWSDDIYVDEDEDDETEFGFWEASTGITWISKVFRAFGWMLPAIAISMLLGTGPNAFFMALALPLAQSALSLVTDTLWGRWSNNPRPKPRPKKKPFTRPASNVGMGKGKGENTRTDKGKGNHQSWTTADEVSVKKGERNTPNFGGWDELDKRGRTEKVPITTPTQKANEPIQQKKIKLSRRVRNREKPLLLRLLIAIFPFLGSWTKLL